MRPLRPVLADLNAGLKVGRFQPGLAVGAFRARRTSRRAFDGWVPQNPNRAWEYSWVTQQVRRHPPGITMRAVDFGAGRSPTPLDLVALGFDTWVVDPDAAEVLGRRYGNEWDFIDYSPWGINTVKAGMEERLFDAGSLGVAVSVSVIEHLPAGIRRRALAELARAIHAGGIVVLTVDLLPGSRLLWNRVVDEIEPTDVHGTADDLIAEARRVGLEVVSARPCPIGGGDTAVLGLSFRRSAITNP